MFCILHRIDSSDAFLASSRGYKHLMDDLIPCCVNWEGLIPLSIFSPSLIIGISLGGSTNFEK